MAKITLYIFHEQYISFEDAPTIVPWHIKLDDELTGLKLRIFLGECEVEIPDFAPVEDKEIKQLM